MSTTESKTEAVPMDTKDLQTSVPQPSKVDQYPPFIEETWNGNVKAGLLFCDAAKEGDIKALQLLRSRGGITKRVFNNAFIQAAMNNRLDAMNLMRSWGASELNLALNGATAKGHTRAAQLLKQMGADDFRDAIRIATAYQHTDLLALLKKWSV